MLSTADTKLGRYMRQRGLTDRDIAKMSGLSANCVRAARTRATAPQSETPFIIARALGVRPDRFWPDVKVTPVKRASAARTPLQDYLNRRNLTPREVADFAGVSQTAVMMW